MKLAICQELFEDLDWEQQCQLIAEAGYTGVEVAPFTLAARISDVPASRLQQMRKVAEDFGLTILGLHWLLAKTTGLHLTTADAAVRRATAEYLVELGNACSALGGNVLVFGSPAQRNLEHGMRREQALENAAGVLRTALPDLAGIGVRICLEPLTRNETDFINTCSEALELIEMVDHPGCCLQQDVKAMLGAERDSIPILIQRHIDRVGHFHVNDTNLLGPGMGDTDFRPILRALVDSGYDRWVSVEVFDYSPGAEKIARRSIHYLREVLAEMGASDT